MPEESRSARLVSVYKRLATSAATLNKASDEFTKPIADIEEALQRLNLGLTTWQRVAGGEDEYENFWRRDIGYARHEGQWGLVIRAVSGNHNVADRDDLDEWKFGDAPRSYRIEAIDKLPELLEELIKNSEKTAKKLVEKAVETRELASALMEAAREVAPSHKERR